MTLTLQWYCLSTKYTADGLANYRKLIFENSRAILDRIPSNLRPDPSSNQKIRINSIDEKMLPSFIDIKVIQPESKQEKISYALLNEFYRLTSSQKISTYTRGSFGFYHQNFSVFGPLDENVRTVRLNPGINPEENDTVVKFFRKLSKKSNIR